MLGRHNLNLTSTSYSRSKGENRSENFSETVVSVFVRHLNNLDISPHHLPGMLIFKFHLTTVVVHREDLEDLPRLPNYGECTEVCETSLSCMS